jgi:DNA-directed RNA polymerase specialized sigma24 family protein
MPVFRNDPELLAAFREGRRDALECVYRTYAPSVGRLVRALARAHARGGELARVNAVTDIFQEVFMRAFSPTSRQAYDGHRDFGPYLMAVARHCFIDALRAQGHEVPRSPHELSRDMDGPSEEPGDGLDPKILRVLTAYVAALPEDVAGVYEQRFVLGHSQDHRPGDLAEFGSYDRRALAPGPQEGTGAVRCLPRGAGARRRRSGHNLPPQHAECATALGCTS